MKETTKNEVQVFVPLHRSPETESALIEVFSTFAIPHFSIIGLAGKEIFEARERVRAAIENSGFEFPKRKIVVNLSPSSLEKNGTHFDLGIALSLLLDGEKDYQLKIVASGELSLDGNIRRSGRPVRSLCSAIRTRASHLILGADDFDDLQNILSSNSKLKDVMGDISILRVETLKQAYEIVCLKLNCKNTSFETERLAHGVIQVKKKNSENTEKLQNRPETFIPFDGPDQVPYDIAIPLALSLIGRHHLYLFGSKGVGKSQAIEWYKWIDHQLRGGEQDLDQMELFELSKPFWGQQVLRGRSGDSFYDRDCESNSKHSFLEFEGNHLSDGSPYRHVGVQVRPATLSGAFRGGVYIPGEFALANQGVLIADEILEWDQDCIELLREPLERKALSLNRLGESLQVKANFTLVAASNMCPCGLFSNELMGESLKCRCDERSKRKYVSRISAAILDRIDLLAEISTESVQSDAAVISIYELNDRILHARRYLLSIHQSLPGQWSTKQTEVQMSQESEAIIHYIKSQRMESHRERLKAYRIGVTFDAFAGAAQKGESTKGLDDEIQIWAEKHTTNRRRSDGVVPKDVLRNISKSGCIGSGTKQDINGNKVKATFSGFNVGLKLRKNAKNLLFNGRVG